MRVRAQPRGGRAGTEPRRPGAGHERLRERMGAVAGRTAGGDFRRWGTIFGRFPDTMGMPVRVGDAPSPAPAGVESLAAPRTGAGAPREATTSELDHKKVESVQ